MRLTSCGAICPYTRTALRAWRALERPPSEAWVVWAVRALVDGRDGDHLRILAGLTPPFDHVETGRIADAALREAGVKATATDDAIAEYCRELATLLTASDPGPMSIALAELADICVARKYQESLMPFYLLQAAREELASGCYQSYRQGADPSNIEALIRQEAVQWLNQHQ